jgi:prepilin-type N-terminal cleavage/methylation domain-containing protein
MQKKLERLNNKGFTMIELAIVLVIIGLLVAGVLKGRELITSAKVKNVAQQIKAVEAAVHTYQDKYRALPGDDKAKTLARFTPAAAGDGDANGQITGTEVFLVPNHLADAGLITGAYDGTTQNMKHKLGGDVTVQTVSTALQNGKTGMTIEVANLPYDVAKAVDELLDDGVSGTGSIVTSAAAEIYDGTVPTVSLYYMF